MRVVLTFAGPGPNARFKLLVGVIRVFGVASDDSLQGTSAAVAKYAPRVNLGTGINLAVTGRP